MANQTESARSTHGQHRPVTVGGEYFPNHASAARKFGIEVATFNSRIRAGWTPEAAARTPSGSRRYSNHPRAVPVTVKGMPYSSISSACKAWGIDISVVRGRIELGWDIGDAFSTPVGGTNPRPRARRPNRNPIMLGGKQYPSVAAACRGLGTEEHYTRILARIKRGMDPEPIPTPGVQCISCLRSNGELRELRTQCTSRVAPELLRHGHDFTVIKRYHQATPAFLGYRHMDLATYRIERNNPERAGF